MKIDIKNFIKHTNFTKYLLQNDIAVAVLSEQISFSAKVGPACLPSERPVLNNRIVKALGNVWLEILQYNTLISFSEFTSYFGAYL